MLGDAEKAADARVGGLALNRAAMALVSNVYRAAAAIRQQVEN